MLYCEFESPKTFDGTPAETKQDFWQFSEVKCSGSIDYSTETIPIYLENVISSNTKNSFFLNKEISYGDFLITSFFIILILGLALAGIRDFAKNRKLERL